MTFLGYTVYALGALIMLIICYLTYQQTGYNQQNQDINNQDLNNKHSQQPKLWSNFKSKISNKINGITTKIKAKQATKKAAKQAAKQAAQQAAQLKNQNYIAYILKPDRNQSFPIIFLKQVLSCINIHPLFLNQTNSANSPYNQESLKHAVFQAYDQQQQPTFQILNLKPSETFDLKSYANNKIEGLVFLLELNNNKNKKNNINTQKSQNINTKFAHMLSVIYEVQKKIGGDIMTEQLQPVTINCLENTYNNLSKI